MSSTDSNLFKYAMQEATQAVALDQASKYKEAKVKYIKAAEILLEFMKYNNNPNLKQACSEKVQTYLSRAKQLGNEKIHESTSSSDSKLFRYAMQEATQAVALDQASKYKEAKVKYIKAAEILVEFMKYTKNPNLKQICSEKVQEYLSRAKQLQGKKKNVKDGYGGALIRSIKVIFGLLLVLIIFLLSQFPMYSTYSIIPVIILIIYFSSLALNRISRINREKIEKIKKEKLEKVKQIDEENLKKRKDLKLKSKRDIEQQIVEKIRSMMEVSERISLEMMRKTLEMDSDEFLNKIWGWAKEFGFRIDGDYIIVENADVGEFVKYLDDQFLNWKEKEGIKEEKNADLLDEIE